MTPVFSRCMKAFVVVALLSGCATNSSPNATAGAVVGGVVGGIAGSAVGAGTGQLVAVGVGTAAGAAIGYGIGASMDHKYPGQEAPYDGTRGPIITGQHAPPHLGSTGTDIGYARPIVYDYPPKTYPSDYRPGPAPTNGCQKLYTVSPYAPTGYACLSPNGTWYINE